MKISSIKNAPYNQKNIANKKFGNKFDNVCYTDEEKTSSRKANLIKGGICGFLFSYILLSLFFLCCRKRDFIIINGKKM